MLEEADSLPAINLKLWVEQGKSRSDVTYRQRQIAEIALNAIASNPELRACLVLKGGALMAIAHGSPRSTSDIDFTARQFRPDAAEWFRTKLEGALERARVRLGYANLKCRVLRVQEEPQGPNSPPFAEATAPALKLKVASARGDGEIKRLEMGQPIHVIDIDVSFREPLGKTADLKLMAGGSSLSVYAVEEVMAEKLRALLQQIPAIHAKARPPRLRRQDIYDVAWLLDHDAPASIQSAEVLKLLRVKAEARGITPGMYDLRDAEFIERMKGQWRDLMLDTGDLPPFDQCFTLVRTYYESLPWETPPG